MVSSLAGVLGTSLTLLLLLDLTPDDDGAAIVVFVVALPFAAAAPTLELAVEALDVLLTLEDSVPII